MAGSYSSNSQVFVSVTNHHKISRVVIATDLLGSYVALFTLIHLTLQNRGPRGFQVVLVVNNLPANTVVTRDMDSILGWGRSVREENGTPLQYSCWGNPMDRGSWGLWSIGLQRVGHD